MSTGEFRSAPDVSANTAQFQAFAADYGEPTRQFGAAVAARSRARLALVIGALAVVVVVIVILAVALG